VTYLVDGSVLCEPTKPDPHPDVVEWLQTHEGELAVDAVILGEIHFGILLLPRGRRRDRLERWFAEGVDKIICLPLDRAVGLRWARLLAHLRSTGRAMPVKDSLIAATALTHGLTVATRNRRDFAKAGVKLVNPFA
jgi:hypothetical protein